MRGPGSCGCRWRTGSGGDDVARLRLRPRSQSGQSSVELVALLPLIALAAVVLVQVGLAAHAWGAAREAARAGARAEAVDAPAGAAARRMLGGHLARGSVVRTRADRAGREHVSVRVRVPMIVPWVPAPAVSAEAEVPG